MKKVGIITGIKRIGFHIAKELLEDSWSLAVIYLSSEKEVERLKGLCPIILVRVGSLHSYVILNNNVRKRTV